MASKTIGHPHQHQKQVNSSDALMSKKSIFGDSRTRSVDVIAPRSFGTSVSKTILVIRLS